MEKIYSITVTGDNGSPEKTGIYYSRYTQVLDGASVVAEDTTNKILSGDFESGDCFALEGSLSKVGQCWHGTVMINCTGLEIKMGQTIDNLPENDYN